MQLERGIGILAAVVVAGIVDPGFTGNPKRFAFIRSAGLMLTTFALTGLYPMSIIPGVFDVRERCNHQVKREGGC